MVVRDCRRLGLGWYMANLADSQHLLLWGFCILEVVVVTLVEDRCARILIRTAVLIEYGGGYCLVRARNRSLNMYLWSFYDSYDREKVCSSGDKNRGGRPCRAFYGNACRLACQHPPNLRSISTRPIIT